MKKLLLIMSLCALSLPASANKDAEINQKFDAAALSYYQQTQMQYETGVIIACDHTGQLSDHSLPATSTFCAAYDEIEAFKHLKMPEVKPFKLSYTEKMLDYGIICKGDLSKAEPFNSITCSPAG